MADADAIRELRVRVTNIESKLNELSGDFYRGMHSDSNGRDAEEASRLDRELMEALEEINRRDGAAWRILLRRLGDVDEPRRVYLRTYPACNT